MDTLKNPLHERVNPRMFDSEPLRRCELGECKGACCVFGVWVDLREVEDIMHNAQIILPHMPEDCRVPGEWFAAVEDVDTRSPSGRVIHTAVENRPDHYGKTACIFNLADGKCALQVAAVKNGLHPWRFKPFYCILHPLDLDEEGRITLDFVEEMVNEKGSCVRSSPHEIPLITTFEPELRYLLGEKGFQSLQDIANKRNSNEFE
jgi:hypothetical protein